MAERVQAHDAAVWAEASRRVEAEFGLHFAPKQLRDLQRGLGAAARALGLPDALACAQRVAAGALLQAERDALARALSIGESYLFRDPVLFGQLAQRILPALIASRRGTTRRLRIWSAGCSTGEEPWSLAMLLAHLLPDWRAWDIRILATDINPDALNKGRRGRYSRWSFRDGVPPYAERFFRPGPQGSREVDAELRGMVEFSHLNLVDDAYPSAQTRTEGMDLILCRNVLIYFETERVRDVVQRLGRCLAQDGWLLTNAVEIPPGGVPGLAVVQLEGLFGLRRAAARAPATPAHPRKRAAAAAGPSALPTAAAAATTGTAALSATTLSATTLSAAATTASRASLPASQQAAAPPRRSATAAAAAAAAAAPAPSAALLAQQARTRADAGDLQQAEALCREAIAQDKLDPAWTFLLASILTEQGALDAASEALRRTLYLDPDHVLAQFCLGSLSMRLGLAPAARRHFDAALARLAERNPDDVVHGSGGLSASELRAAIVRARSAA